MFSTSVNPAALAALEAARRKAKAETKENAALLDARSKAGSLTVNAIYLGQQVSKPKTGNAAAAGQSGGGAPKKDPPAAFKIIVDIAPFLQSHVEGATYNVKEGSLDTIMLPAKFDQSISTCKKSIDELQKKLDAATQDKSGKDRSSDIADYSLQIERAKVELADLQQIAGYQEIKQGQSIMVKTFNKGCLTGLQPMTPVRVMGLCASASIYQGEMRINLDCAAVVGSDSGENPYLSLSARLDLKQQGVHLPDPTQKYGNGFLLMFEDGYVRSDEDAAFGRGGVMNKTLINHEDPLKFKIVQKDKETRPILPYVMWQKQDGSVPGFPAGDFMIQTTIGLYDWDKYASNPLMTGIGITDPDQFAAIMAANTIPAIIECSLDMEKTGQANQGRDWKLDSGTIACYGNACYFFLRYYLLNMCPRVDLKYVLDAVDLDPENPPNPIHLNGTVKDRQNMLNFANYGQIGAKSMLRKEMVVNVSEFQGNLTSLMADNGNIEFRVMHSFNMSQEDRALAANLSPEQGVKLLKGEGIRVELPQGGTKLIKIKPDGLYRVVYLVKPFSPEEMKRYQDAEGSWKPRMIAAKEAAERRRRLAEEEEARKQAALEHDMIKAAEDAERAQQMGVDDGHAQQMDVEDHEADHGQAAALNDHVEADVADEAPKQEEATAAPVVKKKIVKKVVKKVVKRERADGGGEESNGAHADEGSVSETSSGVKKAAVKKQK